MIVNNYSDLLQMKKDWENAIRMSFDVETTGLRWSHNDRIVGWTFLFVREDTTRKPYYVPVRHREKSFDPKLMGRLFSRWFQRYAEQEWPVVCRTWNGNFDYHMALRDECVIPRGIHRDGQLSAHLRNENELNYKLKELGSFRFGIDAKAEQTAFNAEFDIIKENLKKPLQAQLRSMRKHYVDLWKGEYILPLREEVKKLRKKIRATERFLKRTFPDTLLEEILLSNRKVGEVYAGLQADLLLLTDEIKGHQRPLAKEISSKLPGVLEIEEKIKEINRMRAIENYPMISITTGGEYAQKDAILTDDFQEVDIPVLKREGTDKVFIQNCMFLEDVFEMEENGLRIDRSACRQRKLELIETIEQTEKKMYEVAGKEFNPRSTKDVSMLVWGNADNLKKEYDEEGFLLYEPLFKGGKLKRGKSSAEILEISNNPIAEWLSLYRKLEKGKGTYFEAFERLMTEEDRIHPSFKLFGTIGSRISCFDPNLQNLPRVQKNPADDLYKVRNVVIPSFGYELLEEDFSQIELRGLAHYSQDPFLLRAYREGIDVHTQTAEMLGIERQAAKTTNFSVIYGAGPLGLARTIKKETKGKIIITGKQAEQILRDYKNRFKAVTSFKEKITRDAETAGYIRLWTGRRRHYRHRNEASTAVNNLIQGFAGECLKFAFIRVSKMLREYPIAIRPRIVLTVHDSILFEVPLGTSAFWHPLIVEQMENFNFSIPIKAEGKWGMRWSDMTDLK